MAKLILAILLLGVLAQSQAIPRYLKMWPHRIVGGDPASPGELPFQIMLQRGGSFICGGSIKDDTTIITAAHCVQSASSYSIVAGEHDRTVNEGNEQTRTVSRVVYHEQYDDWTLENDVAVLHLSSPLTWNDFVAAIPLPPAGHTASGDAVVSGWGAVSESGSISNILRKVTVPIISDAECRAAYGAGEVADHMICAGLPAGGKDSCQGDSGGPMTSSVNGARTLTGVVSWGYGCARPGYPGVYTEVSHFIDWINSN